MAPSAQVSATSGSKTLHQRAGDMPEPAKEIMEVPRI
jgi:hypothetical protein